MSVLSKQTSSNNESTIHRYYDEELLSQHIGLEPMTDVMIHTAQNGMALPKTVTENKTENKIIRNATDWVAEKLHKAIAYIKQQAVEIKAASIDLEKPSALIRDFTAYIKEVSQESMGAFKELIQSILNKDEEIIKHKANKKITRSARLGDRNKVWLWAIGLGFGEGAFNTFALFSAGYEGGLLAGIAASLFVGAFNLATGYVLGEHFIPYSHKENSPIVFKKHLNRIASVSMILAALVINIWFGLLRVGTNIPSMSLESFDTSVIGFIVIGMLIVYIITRKFIMSDDENKEYGRLSRQSIALHEKAAESRADIRDQFWSAGEDVSQQLEAIEQDEGDDLNEVSHRLAGCISVADQVHGEADRIKEVHETLIEDSRSRVLSAQIKNTPEYFKQKANLSKEIIIDIKTEDATKHFQRMEADFASLSDVIAKARKEANATVDRALENLDAEYNRSITTPT